MDAGFDGTVSRLGLLLFPSIFTVIPRHHRKRLFKPGRERRKKDQRDLRRRKV